MFTSLGVLELQAGERAIVEISNANTDATLLPTACS